MSFDAWRASGPHDDMPSTTQQSCCRCREPWAWESMGGELLCEEHATSWLRDEHRREVCEEIAEEERHDDFLEWSEGP